MGSSSIGAGKSKAEGEMPKDMRQLIKQSFAELTDLRQNLIGQYMGVLQGTGPMKYGVTGTEEYTKKGKTKTRDVYGWTESGEAGAQASQGHARIGHPVWDGTLVDTPRSDGPDYDRRRSRRVLHQTCPTPRLAGGSQCVLPAR